MARCKHRPFGSLRSARALVLAGVALCGTTALADSTVVFNEVMYHSAGGDADLQWIELFNQSAVDMDISGWYVTGGVEFRFEEGTVVAGGGFLVLARSPGALAQETGFTDAYGPFAGTLQSAGQRLELRNNNARLMDSLAYGSLDPWPAGADGSGASLAKRDPDTASGPSRNWRASAEIGGTPGRHNFPSSTNPGSTRDGLVSYWNLDDPVVGAGTYGEDFQEPDGPPVDWYVAQGDVSIRTGRLRLLAAGSESFAWAGVGKVPLPFGELGSISFEVSFVGTPGDTVGRHGGVMFCANDPTARNATTGYTIDWIDRTSDHGYRILKWAGGGQTDLGHAGGGTNPGTVWRIDFLPTGFKFSVDGVELGTYADTTFRTGHVGFWCYSNSGEDVRFDNVAIAYQGAARDLADGNHGTAGSGVTSGQGIVGSGALQFDNSANAFIDVGPGTNNNFSVTTGMTLEALIQPSWSAQSGERDEIFQKEDGEKRIVLAFQHDGITTNRDVPISPAAQPVLSFGLTLNGTYRELDMPLDGQAERPTLASLLDGSPHHVAVTYDAVSGIKAIYVDGASSFSVAVLPAGVQITSGGTNHAFIGNAAGRLSPFTGVIDEVAFWKRTLSAQEIALHAANALDGRSYFALPDIDEDQGPRLEFNEFSLAGPGDSWVEIVNAGTSAIQLQGSLLAASGNLGLAYTFPARSLAPGEFLTVARTALGFNLVAGEKLFLYTADRTGLLAATTVPEDSRARHPDGTGPWQFPKRPTPAAPNEIDATSAIVISEIMYHPMRDDEERGEYVELCNSGATPVDMSGFSFADGIFFTFPEGVIVASGGYLVVARDPSYIAARYGIADVVGPFTGQLANDGERLLLLDARGSVADEVHYYEGGWWPEFADGGGSSLELRDLGADNGNPGAWAASDEARKAVWQTYTYTGTAAADRGPTQWNEFVLGLLDAGEVLLDDIRVTESPSGTPVEFLQNGTFETGANAWRLIGNHRHSEVIADPDTPGNEVLHLIATGATEHMHNHAETTYASSRTVTNGREYRITYRARWLGGSDLLHTRLYFNRVARATQLTIPERRGTPGSANSTAENNIGPTYTAFRHRPIVPEPGAEATVSVLAEDPDGVKRCTLRWSVNGGAWSQAAMASGGDGVWRALIPGAAAGNVVQFYVEGEDNQGALSYMPPRGPDSRALYKVNDGQARLETLHNLRIIMTQSDIDLLHLETNVMSNEHLGATLVYDEAKASYDGGVRLRSSERGRLSGDRVGFGVRFRPDDRFRGEHPSVSIDRAGGWGLGITSGHDEIVIKHIANHAGGIPAMYDDIIRVLAPRTSQTGSALLLMARFNDLYLDSQWENGAAGNLHNYELVYYPTTTTDGNPQSLKRPQPDSVTGVDLRNLGNDEESYRWFFNLENHRDRDDFTRHMEFCKLFSMSGAAIEAAAPGIMDVDEWMRTFALYSLCGVNDTYMYGNYHNNKHYVRPTDNRVLVFSWDMDWCWTPGRTSAALWSTESNLRLVIERTPFTRMYYRHLLDIIDTTYNNAYLDRWIAHYGAKANQNYAGISSFVSARRSYVLSHIPAAPAFAITTNGGLDFTTDLDRVLIEGNAPFEAATIALGGDPLAPAWSTTTRWSVTIPLVPGPNVLDFAALATRGETLATARLVVTSTLNWDPPQIDTFTPVEGPTVGGTLVQIRGSNFKPGIRIRFGGVEAQSVTFLSSIGLEAVSPRGRGQVEIEGENPDGSKDVATLKFTYIVVGTPFQRGDANADGTIDVSDAVSILLYLFAKKPALCLDADDVNDDGELNIADAIRLLAYAFAKGTPPPDPFKVCDADPTGDALDCGGFPACE